MRETIKQIIFRTIQTISFKRIVWQKKTGLYLTFDDGPHENTEKILDVLKKYSAEATFFLVGKNIEKHKRTVKKIVDSGSKIGNHTYSHLKYNGNVENFLVEVEKTDALLNSSIENYDKSIRIPYGVFSLKLLLNLLFKGYKVYFWDVDFKDGNFSNFENGIEKIKQMKLKNGSIILLHDDTQFIDRYLDFILSKNVGKDFFSL